MEYSYGVIMEDLYSKETLAASKYRLVTGHEAVVKTEKCQVMKPNQMECPKYATRAITDGGIIVYMYLCEGHFQILRQLKQLHEEEFIDLDAAKLENNKDSVKAQEV
jgi:hypothetical protein